MDLNENKLNNLKIFPAQRTPNQRNRISNEQEFIFNNNHFVKNYLNNSLDNSANLEKITQKNLILDIGFGNGDQLLSLCKAMPTYNFIGIELYKKGIARLVNQLEIQNLKNIQIIYGEAKHSLQHCFYDHSIERIQIFFSDPWPKRRHHKRRLIQPEFIDLVKNKLCLNGILHIATDSDDYADYIIKIMANFNVFKQKLDLNPSISRTITKFEKRGMSLGHNISDLIYILKN